jgi:hypothetical protein
MKVDIYRVFFNTTIHLRNVKFIINIIIPLLQIKPTFMY